MVLPRIAAFVTATTEVERCASVSVRTLIVTREGTLLA